MPQLCVQENREAEDGYLVTTVSKATTVRLNPDFPIALDF